MLDYLNIESNNADSIASSFDVNDDEDEKENGYWLI